MKIIYFDGVCNLCNWSVRFILKYDKKAVFSFASLQSNYAESNLEGMNGRDIILDSVAYQEGDNVYTRSDAVIKIFETMGGFWKLFYVFKIIPKPVRDWLYDVVAKNRYQWFGKRDRCMIPTREIQSRFLN